MSQITSLPILDLSQLDGTDEQQQAFLDKLGRSARDVGFFYLINHGIDAELSAQVQQLSRRFFAPSEADKQQVETIH